MIRSALRALINAADRWFGLRRLMREGVTPRFPLDGDRALEWSWVVAHLPPPPARVLDLGCVQSPLSAVAARAGHAVTAVDLRPIEYRLPGVVFRQGDINRLDLPEASFDVILNCSTIEHVGLGGRYGATEATDADLSAMRRLAGLLAPEGRMLLTVPVGRDAVHAPFHRVYGPRRLPALLDGFTVLEQEYWTKEHVDGPWTRCERETALATEGTAEFYALGLFVLGRAGPPGRSGPQILGAP
jgi:SAM-dependent methyltransferase